MGCIQANATRLGSKIRVSANCLLGGIQANATRLGSKIRASANLVCEYNLDSRIIFFSKDMLVFTNADNKVGTIKFNTLTAKGDWVLSEVTIEELL